MNDEIVYVVVTEMAFKQQPFGQWAAYQTKHFWPFMVGALVWGALITKVHIGITDKNRAESAYYEKTQRLTHPEKFQGHGHGHH
ncbi:transmembrane protein [Cavenderia fasciculata]|uniref:Transmembrane protein n=1 Tax=Cavenderia fasciculata TaxID=261658 RepID=F4PI48_CACFS|nr:uncharacterized protein DFA_03580 [Cavenderia fasciculata]EGG25331.1 transmembrane protein [Cavenderia fasciculata]|eukprot:XP_004363182.1 transmembrane protein [Cavenderia fasciculata]